MADNPYVPALKIRYLDNPPYYLELRFAPDRTISRTFRTGDILDITELTDLNELERHPRFALLLTEGKFIVINDDPITAAQVTANAAQAAAAEAQAQVDALEITVAGLVGGGGNLSEAGYLLAYDPITPTNTYELVRSDGVVVQETWKRTSNNTLLKSIDYTRADGVVTNELRKVFAANGTSQIARLNITYIRDSGIVVGATCVREV